MASIIKVYEKTLTITGASGTLDVFSVEEPYVNFIAYASFTDVKTTTFRVSLNGSPDGLTFPLTTPLLNQNNQLPITALLPGMRTTTMQDLPYYRFSYTMSGGVLEATGTFTFFADKKY